MIHYTLRISGKVQGVFFRASAKDKADELGIHGIVRNEPDGSVYAEAEGEEKAVEEFIQWCHRGPSRAKVEEVKMEKGEVKGYKGFRVKR